MVKALSPYCGFPCVTINLSGQYTRFRKRPQRLELRGTLITSHPLGYGKKWAWVGFLRSLGFVVMRGSLITHDLSSLVPSVHAHFTLDISALIITCTLEKSKSKKFNKRYF